MFRQKQDLTLLFWHRKSKADQNGLAPIICRISIEGQLEEELSTGKKVHSDHWDINGKKAKGCKEAKEINIKLSEMIIDLDYHFTVLKGQHAAVTPLMLKNVYMGRAAGEGKKAKAMPIAGKKPEKGPNPVPTLLQAADKHIANFAKLVDKGIRSEHTLRQWRATRKKIEEFLIFEYKCIDLELSEIEYSLAQKFYNYLTVEREKNLGEAAAKKQVKNTKEILTFAESSNWMIKNPIIRFRCGGDDTEIPPLEIFEVEQIWRKHIEVERLAEVRDAFIFQCFTGYAFQDVYALNEQNIIRVGVSAERWISKDRGKTGVSEMVPIMPIVEEILERYKNHPCRLDKGLLIPVNSNARYNCYLKELAVICGINRELNTHLARHTFADIMLNVFEFSLAEVSKMLGHNTIRTTQRYARVRKQLISKTFARVKGILFTDDGQMRKIASL